MVEQNIQINLNKKGEYNGVYASELSITASCPVYSIYREGILEEDTRYPFLFIKEEFFIPMWTDYYLLKPHAKFVVRPVHSAYDTRDTVGNSSCLIFFTDKDKALQYAKAHDKDFWTVESLYEFFFNIFHHGPNIK
jgi:hypothetical protein